MIGKNPPSFVVIDKATGLVVYTRRATGVGSEAIAACVENGRKLAAKTGKTYTVFLDIRGLKRGMTVNVPAVYALGITEEIRPGRESLKHCTLCGASYVGTPQMHKFECPPQGGGEGMYKNPSRVRKNIFAFNNPYGSIEGADQDAARELELYIENDADLYRQRFVPIVKNLMLKRRKGIFNPMLAAKLFLYLVEDGAKKYCREFGGTWNKMFSMPTRQLVANHFVFSFSAEADLGNYDRMIGPVSNPIRFPKDPSRRIQAFSCLSCGRRVELEGGDVQCQKCGQWYNSFGQRLKDPSCWSGRGEYEDTLDNGRRVRKNIFTFNNPRKLNALEQAAAAVGLYVTTWAPGDGLTRYRFHTKPADYNDGSAIYTANGRGEAMSFIKAYGIGKSRKNPLNRSEIAQVINMTKDVARTARMAKALGDASRMKANLAYGRGMLDVSMTFGKRGTSRGVRGMLERYNKIESRESSRSNPVCSNPVIRGDKLPENLKRQVLNAFIYRWTSDNSRRESVWRGISGKPTIPLITDAQWLREHAFHVTKGGQLDERHSHAEPYYMADDWKKGDPRPNPLLQTVLLANPPLAALWGRLTSRQRLEIVELAGVPERYSNLSWSAIPPSAKERMEGQWLDTSARRGTTRRRSLVSANPLTRKESARVLRRAKMDIDRGASFRPGHTRSERSGQAFARGMVVRQFGHPSAQNAAKKIVKRAEKVAGTVMSNPGVSSVRFPKPGTKLTVEEAMDLAHKIGDRELIRQCKEAMKLQSKANKGTKCVIWKTLPIGSPTKIDMVTAFTHYGDSPEDMYKAPKGSKKGPHMYRHKWGDGTGKSKPVPVLAAPSGKAIIKLMGPGQKVGDWMRG